MVSSSKNIKVVGIATIRYVIYDLQLVIHCNYVVHRFRAAVFYFPKFEEVTRPWTHLFGFGGACLPNL